MPYYKFGQNDILYNQVKAYPEANFLIYSGNIFYNDIPVISGSHTPNVGMTKPGAVNLYEMNVDRKASNVIYPFVTKNSGLTAFNTVTTAQYNQNFNYGDVISSSYPMSASIKRQYYALNATNKHYAALKTALDSYGALNVEYAYSSSYRNPVTGPLNMIFIPSIYYGSTIKKGSVDLQFYVTGTLIGQVKDVKRNGSLIQVGPTGSNGSGSCVGTILYNEGVILLTSSTSLSTHTETYIPGAGDTNPAWLYFGATGSNTDRVTGSLYSLAFKGTSYTPTITMMAKAPLGELNYSPNPTFVASGSVSGSATSSLGYTEIPNALANVNTSSFKGYNEFYENVTYISSVGIYDDDKNLIGVAKLANPVKKTELLDYLFKLKLDI